MYTQPERNFLPLEEVGVLKYNIRLLAAFVILYICTLGLYYSIHNTNTYIENMYFPFETEPLPIKRAKEMFPFGRNVPIFYINILINLIFQAI